MLILKINKKEYRCKNTDSLTLVEFAELSAKLQAIEKAETLVFILLDYLSDIPKYLLKSISKESLLQIDISNILTMKTSDVNIEFDNVTYGQFLDINGFIENNNYQNACARLLLPKEITYRILEDYEHINNNKGLSIINGYLEWKKELFRQFGDVFIKSNEEEINIDINKQDPFIQLLSSLAVSKEDYDYLKDSSVISVFSYFRGKVNENIKANQ